MEVVGGNRVWFIKILTCLAALIVLLSFVCMSRFGSFRSAIAHVLEGKAISVVDPSVDLGNLKMGEERRVSFIILNRGNVAVRILGAQTTCSCLAASRLPAVVNPADQLSLEVKVVVKRSTPRLEESVRLLTDSKAEPHVTLSIRGRVDFP